MAAANEHKLKMCILLA